jgi:hypothetical protein
VCGYFGCERHAARLFLAGLPSLIKINLRTDAAGRWPENSIRHLLGEANCRCETPTMVMKKTKKTERTRGRKRPLPSGCCINASPINQMQE